MPTLEYGSAAKLGGAAVCAVGVGVGAGVVLARASLKPKLRRAEREAELAAEKEALLAASLATVEELRGQVAQREASLRQVNNQLADSRSRVKSLEGELQAHVEREEELQGQVAQREASLQQVIEQLADSFATVEELRGQVAHREASLRQVNHKLADSCKSLEEKLQAVADLSGRLEASVRDVEKHKKEVSELRMALQVRDGTVADLAGKLEASSEKHEKESSELRMANHDLEAKVADLAGRLEASVRDAAKYEQAPALNFYDAVFTIPMVEDIYDPHKGWPVEVTERREFDFSKLTDGVRVIPLGPFNSGKTWLIGQLSGAELPKGVAVRTEGISIKEATAEGRKIILLDTLGSNSPMGLPRGGGEDGAPEAPEGAEAVEAALQELRVQEDVYRQICFTVAKVVLFVMGQMSHKDQADLVRLARQIRKERARKDIVVVHNLREWSVDMLHEKSKDGKNYVERTKTLLGLLDDSKFATIGTEREQVIRHVGLFKADGDDSKDSVVHVYHYYLTDDRQACSRNRFAIQDMKSIIGLNPASHQPLADEIAAAFKKVQSHFATFTEKEPEVAFDAKKTRFHTKEPVPPYKMKPRDLGSYFTMGSDDRAHSITVVPATIAGTRGRKAYQVQFELPGLSEKSLEDIKKQFQKEESGALRWESVDRADQVTIGFQAELLNIPERAYEEVAKVNSKVELLQEVSEHAGIDSGSRHHFLGGVSIVKVILRTGIMDYDNNVDPIITYVGGILGITLAKRR